MWALDLLVNNAGMAPRERRDILEATEESFDELIATNLKGPHFLTQSAAKLDGGAGSGRIVFVTSISAYTASVNRGEYCVSEGGPEHDGRALRATAGRSRHRQFSRFDQGSSGRT